MSKKKRLISFASSIALVIAIGFGLFAYANQTTVPIGYSFYEWRLSALAPEQVLEEYPSRVDKLRQEKVYFQYVEGEKRSEVGFTFEQLAVKWNDQQVLDEILAYNDEKSIFKRIVTRVRAVDKEPFYLTPTWNEETTFALLRDEWPDLFSREPKNALRVFNDNDEISYTEEQAVFTPDMDQLMTMLNQMDTSQIKSNNQLTIMVPLRKEEPTITVNDLKQQGIERKISQFTTYYSTSSSGRARNVESTSNTLNDTLLAPGEIFSYKDIVAKTDEQYGYRAAPVISNGELRPGIGGGICQISTTLYNAALLSDLEIVERRNHSLPIGYAPLGRDATFTNDGGIDFRFKNSTDNHLLIRSETNNGKLTVKLFGSMPKEKEIEVYTRSMGNNRSGHRVNVYKRVKVNGEVVEEQLVSQDTYRAQSVAASR